MSPNTCCMRCWKVAGAFCKPNGITVYCMKESGVTKAEMSDAHGVKATYQADPTL